MGSAMHLQKLNTEPEKILPDAGKGQFYHQTIHSWKSLLIFFGGLLSDLVVRRLCIVKFGTLRGEVTMENYSSYNHD